LALLSVRLCFTVRFGLRLDGTALPSVTALALVTASFAAALVRLTFALCITLSITLAIAFAVAAAFAAAIVAPITTLAAIAASFASIIACGPLVRFALRRLWCLGRRGQERRRLARNPALDARPERRFGDRHDDLRCRRCNGRWRNNRRRCLRKNAAHD